ncbi:type II secretion system GspH family protein [bacterium]|nr:type II secretion system GspH family protein [bacterium]
MNCDPVVRASRLQKNGRFEDGYTLAGVMVLIGIMSIMMAMSLPVWERIKQRENEEELIFRGKEYTEAIGRYHTKFHSFPPDLETLYKMKFIRKLYKDPMTEKGEWKILHPDSLVETGEAGFINQPGSKKPGEEGKDREKKQEKREEGVIPGLRNPDKEGDSKETTQDGKEISIGPVVGVVSQSKKESLRIYNGQSTYDKWLFAYVPQQEPQQPQQPKGPKVPDKGGKKPPTQTKPANDKDSN